MTKKEMEKLTEMVAAKTAEIVMARLSGAAAPKEEEEEYVSAQEAARILRVTPSYLRSRKEQFPHKKVGSQNQGRVFFLKSGLLPNYLK